MTTMTPRQTKLIVAVGSVVSVLLVVAIVVGVNLLNRPLTEQERVAACMEEHGYPLDRPANEIDGFTMEGLRAAGEACNLPEDYKG